MSLAAIGEWHHLGALAAGALLAADELFSVDLVEHLLARIARTSRSYAR